MRQQKRKRTGKKEKKRGLDGQIEGGVEREIEGGGEREIERLRETERERKRKTLHCSVLSYFMFLISPLHIAEHQLRGNEMRSRRPPPTSLLVTWQDAHRPCAPRKERWLAGRLIMTGRDKWKHQGAIRQLRPRRLKHVGPRRTGTPRQPDGRR